MQLLARHNLPSSPPAVFGMSGDDYITLAMLRTALSATGKLRLNVCGRSMAPLLRPGDAIWVEQVVVTDLRRGDIIVMWHDGSLLTHRLMLLGDRWQTKGDNCRTLDSPIAAELIVGRVMAAERGWQQINFRHRHWVIWNRLIGQMSLAHGRIYSGGARIVGRRAL
ncbi:MAG: S24/S26 family peptidase [Herpetosiphonaceae bacterium]|nr:S24/S26 family peptidase [Herpetosiphonaceae bacterium]